MAKSQPLLVWDFSLESRPGFQMAYLQRAYVVDPDPDGLAKWSLNHHTEYEPSDWSILEYLEMVLSGEVFDFHDKRLSGKQLV